MVAGLAPGAYRFDAAQAVLNPVGQRPDDTAVAHIFFEQPYVANASAILIFTAQLEPSLGRYADRGYRYVAFEVGHAAQNVALCAAALGLGNLQIGGFLDGALSSLLSIEPGGPLPMYAVAVGLPDGSDPTHLRGVGCQKA